MENVKKRMNFRLCNTSEKLVTYASKVTFKSSVIIDKDVVTLNRPSYIGQSVLDIFKVRMFTLQYVDLAKYRSISVDIDIVAGDTDSFFLEVKGVSLPELLSR